ncbi:MAG: KEOPS complex subunit Cgi121 [Methanomassiliicoccales archaeon]
MVLLIDSRKPLIAGGVAERRVQAGDITDAFRNEGLDVQPFDASRIYGRIHLLCAFEYALRAFEHKRNRTATLMTETLLFASMDRQVSRAIDKLGLSNAERIALLVYPADESRADIAMRNIGIRRDDSVVDLTDEKAAVLAKMFTNTEREEMVMALLQRMAISALEM